MPVGGENKKELGEEHQGLKAGEGAHKLCLGDQGKPPGGGSSTSAQRWELQEGPVRRGIPRGPRPETAGGEMPSLGMPGAGRHPTLPI